MHEVGEILLEAQKQAVYQDGLVTMPAYLFEQLNNAVFPESQTHEYTEDAVCTASTGYCKCPSCWQD